MFSNDGVEDDADIGAEQLAKISARADRDPHSEGFEFKPSAGNFERRRDYVTKSPLIHLTNLVANLSAYAENAMEQLELPEANR